MATEVAITVPQLRMWRCRRFLSQLELAQRAEVAASTVHLAENGARVRFGTARKLAEALGIEPAQLCDETPEMAGANG